MATTSKVIVQIHERTTEILIDPDLQLRELGYMSAINAFRFNNNAGSKLTIWAQESTGVTFDNAVTLSSRSIHNDGIRLGDNDTIELGNAQDATIKYDGVNLVLSPKLVGSGTVTIAGSATIQQNLTVVGTSTLGGLITSDGGVTLGIDDDLTGSASSDILFNTDKFVVKGSNGFVGIGTASPSGLIDIQGTHSITNAAYIRPDLILNIGNTSSVFLDVNNFSGGIGSITTEDDNITYTHIASVNIGEPKITKGASDTITVAATLRIADAPTEGTSNYALWVDSGSTQLDGTFAVTSTSIFTGKTTHNSGLTMGDNDKAFFGDGEDASILYDGTDLQIETQEVGTGKLIVSNGLRSSFGTFPSGVGADAIGWIQNTSDAVGFIGNAGSGIGLRVQSNSGNILSVENSSSVVRLSVSNAGLTTVDGTLLSTGLFTANGGVLITNSFTFSATSPSLLIKDSDGAGNLASPLVLFKESGNSNIGLMGFASSGNDELTLENTTATGTILLKTNATTALTLDASQKGTFAGALDVVGVIAGSSQTLSSSLTVDGAMTVNDGNGANNFEVGSSGEDGRVFFVDTTSDKVAIGQFVNFAPTASLHIHGAAGSTNTPNADANLLLAESGGNSGISIGVATNGAGFKSSLLYSSGSSDDDVGGYVYTHNNGTTTDTLITRVGTATVLFIKDGNLGIGSTAPNASALLHMSSTTKAFMPPQMTTTQRDAISSPIEGMYIHNTTTNVLDFHNGTSWGAV